MSIPRSCGVLLHPTSLPGGHGIGDLGWEAYRFVDFLAAAGQRYWQVLPLGPTGYGDSPYQCFSAFAGNHLLISLERLAEEGLVTSTLPAMPGGNVNYGFVVQEKMHHLKDAFKTFRERASAIQKERFSSFLANPRARWLDDYALFRAIKDHFNGASWTSWDKDLVDRKPEALESWSRRLSEEVLLHRWLQYQFFRQWAELRAYCNASGVSIIGDVPIFVSHDSSDVWANPGLFHLDEAGNPTIVAGVPPDYFSKTGQLWGNPLYRWEKMHAAGYRWWIDRVQWGLMAVDILRLDHFRGFEAYWEVPASEKTAVNGRWVKGPGERLFLKLREALGGLPIIAEDLGVITPEVEALRDGFALPGMRILQFGFGDDPTNVYLPHNFDKNCVVYTGTHDNETTVGWFHGLSDREKGVVRKYLGEGPDQIPWSLIRLAFSSVASLAVIPAQDLLGLGCEARMNSPGRASGNWGWRLRPGALTADVGKRLLSLAKVYGRA